MPVSLANRSFSVSLVVNVVESGQVVGTLDVIDVPGCDVAAAAWKLESISRVYDVPGRAIRFSTNADPRADGDVHIFGC